MGQPGPLIAVYLSISTFRRLCKSSARFRICSLACEVLASGLMKVCHITNTSSVLTSFRMEYDALMAASVGNDIAVVKMCGRAKLFR